MQILISMEGISTRIGEKLILENTSWVIEKGRNWAVIGPNGSGKTLLTQVLCRRRPIVAGRMRFADGFQPTKDISLVSFESQKTMMTREGRREEARHFSGRMLAYTPVYEVLKESAHKAGSAEGGFIEKVVNLCGISSLLDRNITHLSTGEFRKVLVAKALLSQPKLLILDEPMEGLDTQSRHRMAEMINRLVEEKIQIVMVSHRLDELPAKLDHVIFLKKGKVINKGRRRDLMTSQSLQELYRDDSGAFVIDPETVGFVRQPRAEKCGPIIVMEKVTVRYGRQVVFKDLDWTVESGENWMVSGPNGAGKSTLLSLISGDSPQAYANQIYLFGRRRGSGESIWDIKRRMGVVSSEFQLRYQRNITVYEVVLSGFFDSVGIFRQASSTQKKHTLKWLEIINFSDRGEQNFNRLSFGEQRRVLIARAMVKAPELLILDEPCQGLDPESRRKVLKFIDTVGRIEQVTLIYVTHHGEEKLDSIRHELKLCPKGFRQGIL